MFCWLCFRFLDGMLLQVWNKERRGRCQLMFIPQGCVIVLPGDTVHGGGFTTSPSGNYYGYLYIFVKRRIVDRASNVKVEYSVNLGRVGVDGLYQPA
jgi:hypothetical protein